MAKKRTATTLTEDAALGKEEESLFVRACALLDLKDAALWVEDGIKQLRTTEVELSFVLADGRKFVVPLIDLPEPFEAGPPDGAIKPDGGKPDGAIKPDGGKPDGAIKPDGGKPDGGKSDGAIKSDGVGKPDGAIKSDGGGE